MQLPSLLGAGNAQSGPTWNHCLQVHVEADSVGGSRVPRFPARRYPMPLDVVGCQSLGPAHRQHCRERIPHVATQEGQHRNLRAVGISPDLSGSFPDQTSVSSLKEQSVPSTHSVCLPESCWCLTLWKCLSGSHPLSLERCFETQGPSGGTNSRCEAPPCHWLPPDVTHTTMTVSNARRWVPSP